jgi:tight adherence protein C
VIRLLALSTLATWLGATLLLSCSRVVRRPRLLERLRPYAAIAPSASSGRALLSADSFRQALRPVAEVLGARFARLVGVEEDLGLRLRRVHSPMDPAAFRLRQLGFGVLTFGIAGAATFALPLPPAVALLMLVGAPVLTFLVTEHQLASASARWQEHTFHELPVVAEQLGMLLSSGWSLGTAVQHVAQRGDGTCSRDLARVASALQHGRSEHEALHEWAEVVRVDALDRLVAVLALSREATDLGELVAAEARAIRRDVHRELLEAIERRAQQVWIPVTVATLVPGVLLLVVPFVQALQLFSTA